MLQSFIECSNNKGQEENTPMGHAHGPEQVCWTPLPERLRTGNYWGLCSVRWQSEPRVRQFKPLHSRRGSHTNITGRMVVTVDAESPGGPKRPQTRPETLRTGVAWCLRDPVTHNYRGVLARPVRPISGACMCRYALRIPFSNALKRVLVPT